MARPSERFKQTISWKSVTSRDAWGAPTFGSLNTANARVEPKRKLVRNSNGDEVLSSHVVYTAAAIVVSDQVWFPGENTSDANKARRPLAIDEYVDGDGLSVYRKVWF
jgi:hypothetical protein